MDVSVIIPTFNRWPMLAEAVTSVMAQRSVDFELIIVDDGSTDETGALLPHLLEELDTQRTVRILRTANRGPAAARNYGVEAARAPLISFLDSDDFWRPDKLQQQLQYMMKKPECLASQTEEIWIRRGIRVDAPSALLTLRPDPTCGIIRSPALVLSSMAIPSSAITSSL